MVGAQDIQCIFDYLHALVGLLDAQRAKKVLQHVDALPAIRGIDHEGAYPLRPEDASQRPQATRRVGEMMKNPLRGDKVKVFTQGHDILDRALVQFEVAQ